MNLIGCQIHAFFVIQRNEIPFNLLDFQAEGEFWAAQISL